MHSSRQLSWRRFTTLPLNRQHWKNTRQKSSCTVVITLDIDLSMSMFDGISQVQVGLGRNISKVVRKWTDEQTDIFATVLTQKHFKNGQETTWSEELESLAVKKSSNEYVFKEVQIILEQELDKFDQSHREAGDEATFTIPQLRAKYKWLKREWKVIQNKIKCGLLSEDGKYPGWFTRLHNIFSIFLIDSDRPDRDDDRPSMVSENGSLINGRSSIDNSNSDVCPEIAERSWVVNIDPHQADIPEICGKSHSDGENDTEQKEDHLTRKRPFPLHEVRNPNSKIRKFNSRIRDLNNKDNTFEYSSVPCQCNCKMNGNYVEVIKNILNADERREKMLVDFQREQAQLSRQHELKMAQMFLEMASQQNVLVTEIENIKELILSKK